MVNDRHPAEEAGRVSDPRPPMWQLRQLGEAGHHVRVRRLLQDDDVGRTGADHGRNRRFAPRTPEPDVVAQESEGHALTLSSRASADASSFFPSMSAKYGWSINTSRANCTMLDVAWMFTARPAMLHKARRSGT